MTTTFVDMNNKEQELNRIVDSVISCCSSTAAEITKEQVLGQCRKQNVVMTRCILASQIVSAGYSVTTAASLLGRSEQGIRALLKQCYQYHKESRAYRIAYAEATLLCKDAGLE